jgi:hypothetical protein
MMQRQLGDSQIKQGKKSLKIFYEKVAEGLLASAAQKIQLKVRRTGQLAD